MNITLKPVRKLTVPRLTKRQRVLKTLTDIAEDHPMTVATIFVIALYSTAGALVVLFTI